MSRSNLAQRHVKMKMQKYRDPLVMGQFSNRPPKVLGLQPSSLVATSRLLHVREPNQPRPSASAYIATLVRDDADEPRLKRLSVAKVRQLAPGPQRCLLKDVLCLGAIADHRERKTCGGPHGWLEQALERGLVAGFGAGDKSLFSSNFHLGRTMRVHADKDRNGS